MTNTLCHMTLDCSAMIENHFGMYCILIPYCISQRVQSWKIYYLSIRHHIVWEICLMVLEFTQQKHMNKCWSEQTLTPYALLSHYLHITISSKYITQCNKHSLGHNHSSCPLTNAQFFSHQTLIGTQGFFMLALSHLQIFLYIFAHKTPTGTQGFSLANAQFFACR